MRKGCTTAGIGCIDCKGLLIRNLLPVLEPLHARRAELEAQSGRVREVLVEGSRRARALASETLREVRQAMKVDY